MNLSVSGVSKRLGATQALDGVSFEHDVGVLAILGENGAGKSTLLQILVGLIRPDAGAVTVAGRSVADARHTVGFVPEAADPLPFLSVHELLSLVAAVKAAPVVEDMIETLGLRALLDQRIGTLSLGQRRRACLAAALTGRPWLLVLDEPTNGLDAEGTDSLARTLERHVAGGGIAVVATHDVAFCERVARRTLRLRAGRIV
ncbi:MAG TPA: ABC transporter ATP-binding protein [Haliangiales bacterium]|nr:ABC transporter ATP-binding protein [Haliangiales bacterium]